MSVKQDVVSMKPQNKQLKQTSYETALFSITSNKCYYNIEAT